MSVVPAPTFNNHVLEVAQRINNRAMAQNNTLMHELRNMNESMATIASTNAALVQRVLNTPSPARLSNGFAES